MLGYLRSPLEKTRYETSLGLLTKKFVNLFHSDPSGTVDLNRASIGKFLLNTVLVFLIKVVKQSLA